MLLITSTPCSRPRHTSALEQPHTSRWRSTPSRKTTTCTIAVGNTRINGRTWRRMLGKVHCDLVVKGSAPHHLRFARPGLLQPIAAIYDPTRTIEMIARLRHIEHQPSPPPSPRSWLPTPPSILLPSRSWPQRPIQLPWHRAADSRCKVGGCKVGVATQPRRGCHRQDAAGRKLCTCG